MIDYCVRGRSNPVLKTDPPEDHVAEACMSVLDDVDWAWWMRDSPSEGKAAGHILQKLSMRVHEQKDLAAARLLYAIAVEATQEVLSLYLRQRQLFDKITPHCNTLPCLHSIHPNSAKIIRQMLADAKLGSKTDHAHQANSRACFVSDRPANVYAPILLPRDRETFAPLSPKNLPRSERRALLY